MLVLSKTVKDLISLRDQMKEMNLCTLEVQDKINKELTSILTIVEGVIKLEQEKKKELLSMIIDPDEVPIIPVVPEVKEIETKSVEIKLNKETAYKVDITELNKGTTITKDGILDLKFKGKQKVGQDAFVFEWVGNDANGWISNHVLYVGTTYLDRKFGKLYIVTKDGITSVDIEVLKQYIVNFGKEVLIGDGMSIVNPNYLKIKVGFDINFV